MGDRMESAGGVEGVAGATGVPAKGEESGVSGSGGITSSTTGVVVTSEG